MRNKLPILGGVWRERPARPMEFTEAIPAFGGRAVLSPSGRLLARLTPSADFILLVQSTDTLSVVFSTPVPLLMDNDAASTIPKSKHFPPPRPRRILPQDIRLTWSPDSQKLMIVDGPVNRVFIYNLAVPEVEEAGFILQESMPTSRFFWSPRSDHVVSVLDYRIGLRVWSLDARYPIRAITGIKSSGDTGIDFCAEGNMMAVLHRKEGLDVIVIYSCSTWDALQVSACCWRRSHSGRCSGRRRPRSWTTSGSPPACMPAMTPVSARCSTPGSCPASPPACLSLSRTAPAASCR